MDLDAVRTFVAAADAGQFQEAPADLSITQQAVSKRIAALEKCLGVRLFTRTPRGARLTGDGQAFLPHARELLDAEERAAASVRRGGRARRALRVDVIGRRLAPAALLRDFHRAHPAIELDVVTLFDATATIAALRSGTIDASFRAVMRRLPDGIEAARVFDEPVQLLTGSDHELAAARTVTPAELAGHRIWMPGIAPGTEWAAYYAELAAVFGLTIDVVGPDFGTEPLLDVIAGSPALATFVGERTHLLWPAGYDLRRIALHDPAPVYPHSLIWRGDNQHPALTALRDHFGSSRPGHADAAAGTSTWAPAWAVAPVMP